jgi:hypothetical protein
MTSSSGVMTEGDGTVCASVDGWYDVADGAGRAEGMVFRTSWGRWVERERRRA